ncbi:peptide ABC transporter substrate-binding protein [Acaryochloris sp. 'Moss Beach']|uniref:ABC transporter substrate-binding protein n=1 Tax=Acaryochloris sp. 'Moss Beach' TaxID=2740837 RepID=UPI001F4303E7|nr:ABC transporter substrate-binding protein [Acaryochloris sp. 'Moss Beach']UJB72042.1 peptide ABC transporter substrate-binding protein [Acaryochloris sp. 'Moss Beach']
MVNAIATRFQLHKLSRKWIGLFCLVVLLVLSCSPRPSDLSTNSEEGRITLGSTAKIRTIDPADAYELFPATLLYNMGETLYTYDLDNTTLNPQLATVLPTVSEDGLIYKIPLRQGVVFHDGTPFNAEAMAFSLQRFMDNGGQPSFLLAEPIAEVKASGDYELQITLNQPFAALPALLTFFGACAVSPQAYTIGPGAFKPKSFVGTGPYKLVDYRSDNIRLDVFEQYWGDKPANSGINLQLFSTPANLFNQFKTGAIDVGYQGLETDQIQSLQAEASSAEWQVIEAKGNAVTHMVLNVKQKPLDQVTVRRAIALLVDRPLIKKRVYQGQAEPLYSLIPSTFDAARPVFQSKYGDGDAAQARQLLTAAGYSAQKPLTLDLWYPSNYVARRLIANLMKAVVEERSQGILKLKLEGVESTVGNNSLSKGIYPAYLVNWYPDFFDPDTYIQPFLSCSKGTESNGCEEGASRSLGSFYYNGKINRLIKQQRQTQDDQERQTFLTQIQEVLAEDIPYIPLIQRKEYAFSGKGIEGVQITKTQQFPLWTIRKS